MLPGVSGLDLCKKWRAGQDTYASKVPIFMVTARAHTSDIVLGLEMGADDYITKPFELPLFLARVRALLRRASLTQGKVAENKVNIGDLTIDTTTYQVTCGKKDIQLTPSEFKLLSSLMKNRGRVLTRERLIDLVQGEGVTVVDRTIDTHVFGLRKKLGKCSDVVETIRGVGYRVKSE
jgi:two-component system phosphate regulon response regulator PhoB